MTTNIDNDYRRQGYIYIAGTDEAGRGPLAGPVVAAAVIFPPKYENEVIDDSKQLTEKSRNKLFEIIKENAISYAIVVIEASVIDEINIYQASKRAMEQALNQLTHPFDLVLTDAMPLSHTQVGVVPLIKGDTLSLSIAAASILAKVTRDKIMEEIDQMYPQYGFKDHKGYATKKHLENLKKFGPIKGIHRYSYRPVADVFNEQLTLF
ncbi:MAG TPA: ribonuclease HII [Bacilli bacterium]|nr:ribonuclease HII [Bacilli bacterium]